MPSFNGIAYPVADTQVGISLETTRGTANNPPQVWVPVKAPKYKPNLSLIPDQTLQGSMVDTYDLILGIRYDGHGWNAPPYMDSFPYLLAAEFGSPDNLVAKPTGTITLTNPVTAGSTSVTFSGATGLAAKQWFTIGSAANGTLETHQVITLGTPNTIDTPFINAFPAATAVTFLTTHRWSLLNNQYGLGNQPPSCTITDFDGESWRQITAAQLDQLNIKGNGTSLVDYSCTWFGNPATQFVEVTGVAIATTNATTITIAASTLNQASIANLWTVTGTGISGAWTVSANTGGVITVAGGTGTPVVGGTYTFTPPTVTWTSSFGTTQTPAPWTFYVKLGGTYSPTVMDWEFDFKRNVKPIPALTGQQAYFTYFAGPLTAGGKMTFIEQAGSPQLNAFLNAVRTSLDVTLFDQHGGTAMNIYASNMQYKTGEIDRSKEYVTVMLDFELLPSGTDALAGGVAPCIVSVANTVTTAYNS
jgi:hypothetical protein